MQAQDKPNSDEPGLKLRKVVNTNGSPGKMAVDFGDRVVDEDLKRKVAERFGKLSKVVAQNKAGNSSVSGAAAYDNSLTLKKCHMELTTIVQYENGHLISDVAEYRDLRDTLCSQFALMGLDSPDTMMLDSELCQGK